MRYSNLHRKAILLVVFATSCIVGTLAHTSQSASLTSVSATMANPRLSWYAFLDSVNTVGESTLVINDTDGAAPSTSTAGLQNDSPVGGDTQSILINGTVYLIEDVINQSTLALNTGLASGDEANNEMAVASQSGTISVRFTSASAITGGQFRVLIPAQSTNAGDGLPDAGFFDFGSATAPGTLSDVTCPVDETGYDFISNAAGGGDATASAVTINSQVYHAYSCRYSGAGAAGVAFGSSTDQPMDITGVINPAPRAATHTIGTADAHRIIVQHLDGDTVIDSTTVSVGTIESVRVTATVDPQLTFRIFGVAASTSVCGTTTDVLTTSYSVPFGSLSITDFTDAAQGLAISTNASGGYVVTAAEDDQLSRNGNGCTNTTPETSTDPQCIQDAFEDLGGISDTSSADWEDEATEKGFGFSLSDAAGTTVQPFVYNESLREFSARHFADLQAPETPQTIFSNTTVADNEGLFVCYRVLPAVSNQAGNYENNITYRATATF